MLLPYATDKRPARNPVMTLSLLVINLTIMLILEVGARMERWEPIAPLQQFGLVPNHVNPLTLLTYMFVHASFAHLLINGFYLWLFGAGVEEAVGSGKFVSLYVASGIVGGALQWLATTALLPAAAGNVPIVGASAACAGLIGLYVVRYYRERIAFVGLPFRPHVVTVTLIFLGYEIGTGVYNLLVQQYANGVANWAHVGGFIFGLGVAQLLHLSQSGQMAYLQADTAIRNAANEPGENIRRWEFQLERDPNNVLAHTELGHAWLALGDAEQAGTHFMQAISLRLSQNRRAEAALLYAEMRGLEMKSPAPATEQLFALGSALEEVEQYELAAETLRAVTLRQADAPEAETALLKVISLYVHKLNRNEEARILLKLFMERYPHSQWRGLAQDLSRAAAQNQIVAQIPSKPSE